MKVKANHRSHPAFLLILVPLLLLSCSKPVPPEKQEYVGEWKSKEMYMLILADGSLRYQRLKGGGTVEVSGPIKEFQGDNIVVGIGFITTTFEVSTPPHEEDGVWKMVVDGVELVRSKSETKA